MFKRMGFPTIMRDGEAGGAAGGAAQGGAAQGGAAGNATPWYEPLKVDAEIVGHWQNKGWDVSKPENVALAASKQARELERMVGMRGDHDLLPIPKDIAKGDLGPVWERLGKPKTAAEYGNFEDIKFKDGSALDEPFVNAMRDRAFKANLTKNAAVEMVKGTIEFMDAQDARESAEKTASVAAEREALAKEWGTTPDKLQNSPHMLRARLAVEKLGWDPEMVNALETAVGYSKVMNALVKLGARLAPDEDNYFGGDKGRGNNGLLTREQAVDRKKELYDDSAWVTKFLAGDREARREMAAIDSILSPKG